MATRIAVALALALAPSLVDGHGYLSYPISRNYRARVPEASGEQVSPVSAPILQLPARP